jgi:hypothetical protein
LPVRAVDSRSPFVRLRDLLGDAPPRKPAISMAVGEPQHPIPPFVAPVIAAHIEEFGRYPMNKGLDVFAEDVRLASRSNFTCPAAQLRFARARGRERHECRNLFLQFIPVRTIPLQPCSTITI